MLQIKTDKPIWETTPCLSTSSYLSRKYGLANGAGRIRLSAESTPAVFHKTFVAINVEQTLITAKPGKWDRQRWLCELSSFAEENQISMHDVNEVLIYCISRVWTADTFNDLVKLSMPGNTQVHAGRVISIMEEDLRRIIHGKCSSIKNIVTANLTGSEPFIGHLKSRISDVITAAIAHYWDGMGMLVSETSVSYSKTPVPYFPSLTSIVDMVSLAFTGKIMDCMVEMDMTELRNAFNATKTIASDGSSSPARSANATNYVDRANVVRIMTHHGRDITSKARLMPDPQEVIATIYELCSYHWTPPKTRVRFDHEYLLEHKVVLQLSRNLMFFMRYDPKWIRSVQKSLPSPSRIKNHIFPAMEEALAKAMYYREVPIGDATAHIHHVDSIDMYNRPVAVAVAEAFDSNERPIVFAAEEVPHNMLGQKLTQFIKHNQLSSFMTESHETIDGLFKPSDALSEYIRAISTYGLIHRRENSPASILLPMLGSRLSFGVGSRREKITQAKLFELMKIDAPKLTNTIESKDPAVAAWVGSVDKASLSLYEQVRDYNYEVIMHYVASRAEVSLELKWLQTIGSRDVSSSVGTRLPRIAIEYQMFNVRSRFPVWTDAVVDQCIKTSEPMHLIPALSSRPQLVSMAVPSIDIDRLHTSGTNAPGESKGHFILHTGWWKRYVTNPKMGLGVTIHSMDASGKRHNLVANPKWKEIFSSQWDAKTYLKISEFDLRKWEQWLGMIISSIHHVESIQADPSQRDNHAYAQGHAHKLVKNMVDKFSAVSKSPISRDWKQCVENTIDCLPQLQNDPALVRARLRVDSKIEIDLRSAIFAMANLGVETDVLIEAYNIINSKKYYGHMLSNYTHDTEIRSS